MNDEQPFRGARYASLDRAAGPVKELHTPGDVLDATDPCQCGTCGRWWDDAVVTSITPTPSGRCPFEYDHDHEEPDVTVWVTLARCGRWERAQLATEDAMVEHGADVLARYFEEDHESVAWLATVPAGEMARLRKSFGAGVTLRTLV